MLKKATSLMMIFLLAFSLWIYPSTISSSTLSDMQERMREISLEERSVIDELFIMSQEITQLKNQEQTIQNEINDFTIQISQLERDLFDEQYKYDQTLMLTEQVLKSYQRMGSASTFEIIFQSKSLSDFIVRMNILRDFSKNTQKTLNQLNRHQEQLIILKSALDKQLLELETKQLDLQRQIQQVLYVIEERETYLENLADQRLFFEEHVNEVERAWESLKQLFPSLQNEFTQIITSGNLPQDALRLNITLFRVVGILEDQVLNRIIEEQTEHVALRFFFYPEKTVMEINEYELILEGQFVLENNIIRFEAQKGTFFGMNLLKDSIDELFVEGELFLDLNPILDGNNIRSIQTKEGELEMIIIPRLF